MGDETKNHLLEISRQLKKMDEKLDALDLKVGNFESRVAALEVDVENNYEKCKGRTKNLEKSVDNRFLSLEKAHELVVNGFPADFDKSEEAIFELISASLGYRAGVSDTQSSAPNVPPVELFRLPSRASLVIRFASIFDKKMYLQRYLNVATTLTHRTLGISNDRKKRIYIQQNLPSALYKLFRTALGHVKSGKIKKVKISSFGDIMVKVNPNDRFVPVRNNDDLKVVMAKISKK
jgi:hypothetical protein